MPTYNRAQDLQGTLAMLRREIGELDVDVVVQDNGSTDETGEMVRSLQQAWRRLIYHRNTTNLGPDRNFCLAIERSTADFAWLFGDDDRLVPGALASVLDCLDRDPALSLVYVNWLDEPRLRADAKVAGGDAFLRAVHCGPAFMGSLVVRKESWLLAVRDEFVGTGLVHLYAALGLMSDGTAYCISKKLVDVGLPDAARPHWTRSKAFVGIFFANICLCLRSFAGRPGYSEPVVEDAIALQLRPLLREVVRLRAFHGLCAGDIESLRQFHPTPSLRWMLVAGAARLPRAAVASIVRLHRTLLRPLRALRSTRHGRA